MGVNETISVGAAQEITIGAVQAVTIGANQTVNVGANQSTSVGSNQTLQRGAERTAIGRAPTLDERCEGADRSASAMRARPASARTIRSRVGKNLTINAGDSVTIKTGSASITMKKDGTIVDQGQGHHDRRQRQDQRQGVERHHDEGQQDQAELISRRKAMSAGNESMEDFGRSTPADGDWRS